MWLVIYERVSHTAARGRGVETALAEHRSILDEQQYHWVRLVHFGSRKERSAQGGENMHLRKAPTRFLK